MSIEAGIIAYLQTKKSITDISGSGTASRIRAAFFEEGDIQTGPGAIVMGSGNSSTPFMGGVTNTSNGTVTVDCWASDYGSANDLAAAIANVTNGYRGFMGNSNVKACFVQQVIDVPPEISPELRALDMFGRRVELYLLVEDPSPTFV
jgi:hypothetical protein